MVDKTKEALEMAIDAMEKSKRPHAYCEDTWYSCPKHEEGCADVRQGDECNCGADSVNLKLQKTINACKEVLAELQQQSAMQQLEIMRLREALETSLNCIDRTGWEFSCDMRLFGKKLDRYKDLLSTPTTYDDLMAWHEAQLGEPVAWITEDTITSFGYLKYGYIDRKDRAIPDSWQPLYAKKG